MTNRELEGLYLNNSLNISQLTEYVTIEEISNTFTCDVSVARNFAFTIADTDAKVVVLSNTPTVRCEVMLEITTTAAGTVTWTLNDGAVAWAGGSEPTLEANKTYNILLIKKAGETSIRAYASAGV